MGQNGQMGQKGQMSQMGKIGQIVKKFKIRYLGQKGQRVSWIRRVWLVWWYAGISLGHLQVSGGTWLPPVTAIYAGMGLTLSRIPSLHGGLGGHWWFLTRDFWGHLWCHNKSSFVIISLNTKLTFSTILTTLSIIPGLHGGLWGSWLFLIGAQRMGSSSIS